MKRSVAALLALGFVAACTGGAASESSDLTEKYIEGSDEALAILAVVNDRTLGVSQLDVDAKLTSKAAKAIIAHRDGPDGLVRTPDDDLYETLAELDAQPSVGPTTLNQLLAYASQKGYLADQKAKKIEPIFSPQPMETSHLARIAGLIDGAQRSIDIAMYSYSDATIQKALQKAVARGVAVRFVFETAGEDKSLTGSALASSKSGQLEAIGVDVRYVNEIMHHKVVIVDGPRDDVARAKTARVASGSANWSGSAAVRYDENTLFFEGYPELALRLQREFDTLWAHSRDFVSGEAKPYVLSTLAITDDLIPEDPNVHAYFTSSNFDVKDQTFSANGESEIADALVAAIRGAKKSIHIASGHLRSRPVAEALEAKIKESPKLDLRVYLDGQEYIGQTTHDSQIKDRATCLAAAGASEAKIRLCNDKGFLFGYEVGRAGVAVKYKYYAYRWDSSYAKQMHDKYFVFDGTRLITGSYNLSDNAEHETFENVLSFQGPEFAELLELYEKDFERLWATGQGKLAPLTEQVKTASTIPLVFDPMALTWAEVTDLKKLIRANCTQADSDEFRRNAPAHQSCPRH
jgi:phosphatidylserine/phosphatidylglycerophosphate/cardiolipin synthase-like enzyme